MYLLSFLLPLVIANGAISAAVLERRACNDDDCVRAVTGTHGLPTPTVTVHPSSTCLSPAQATQIVNKFGLLLTNPQGSGFVALATSLLADDFTDTSDSINFLAGIPLTTVTFPSRDAFIAGQGGQVALTSLTTLNIWIGCNTITWRWRAVPPLGARLPVTGINVFEINSAGQIETVFAEFDNGAWLVDLGNPECAAKLAKKDVLISED